MTKTLPTGVLAEALVLISELAAEVEIWVNDRYDGMLDFPSQKLRYERDIEPVVRALDFLEKHS